MLTTHPVDAGLSGLLLAAGGHAGQDPGDKLFSDQRMSVKHRPAGQWEAKFTRAGNDFFHVDKKLRNLF